MALSLNPGHLVRNGAVAARVWLNQHGPSWVLQPTYAQIADALQLQQGAFLDLGCGAGWLGLYVARGKPELDVVGVDTDSAALAVGERNKGTRLNVTLREMPLAQILYPDATFDAAGSFCASARWGDVGAVLAEVYRVLKPGGVLHIYEVDPDLDALPEGWLRSPGPWLPDAALLAGLKRRAVDADAWAALREHASRSPFQGGEDGRHGPFRRLVLRRPAVAGALR